MSITLETLEGRLLAQRKVIARLVAGLDRKAGDALLEYLRDNSQIASAEEDPGSVPGEGLSIEGALADEMRLMAEAAEAHRKPA